MARLDSLARYAFVFCLIAGWGGCGGKSSGTSTGTAGTGGAAGGITGGGGLGGDSAGTGGNAGSLGGAAAGGVGTGGIGGSLGGTGGGGAADGAAGSDGGSTGGAGGTGGAPCAQDGAACDFPDTTCFYEMHPAGAQNYYYGCTCNRGDGGLSRIKCCFVGNAFSPNGVLTPANQPDWWLTPSGSSWRCPPGS